MHSLFRAIKIGHKRAVSRNLSSLALLCMFSSPLFSQTYTVDTVPNPRIANGGFVADPQYMLGKAGIELNARLTEFELETGNEVAVVVLPSIGGRTPKDFALELFNQWGIGKQGKDNGVLLLLVMDQRRWEFMTGYGLEGILPDDLLHNIGQEYMIHHIKDGNYGAGVAAGIDAVLEKLGGASMFPAPERTTALREKPGKSLGFLRQLQPRFDDSENKAIIFFVTLGGILTLFYLIAVSIIASYQSDTDKISANDAFALPRARLHGAVNAVLWLVLGWWILLTGFALATILVAYAGANAVLAYQRSRRNVLLGRLTSDAYSRYRYWLNDHRGLFRFYLFIFPVGILPFYLYYRHKLKSLRNEPRNCPLCQSPLVLLDERADDSFLTEGKRMEEYLKTINYDVWDCETCDYVEIQPYAAEFTSYSPCVSCGHKTYHTISDKTLSSPTCHSSGTGERHNKCEYCKHEHTETYTIPKRDCSSSRESRSGGSRSGGSSFGGGRSGGGGSGGSW